MKTLHGGFYQEPCRKNTSVKVCTMPGGFQLIPVCSGCQPLFMIDEVSLWYLLVSLFSIFLKLRASENEEMPKPVPHYLYTPPMDFSVRKNNYIWVSGDVSANFCNSHLNPPFSEGQVVCSRHEGIWEDFGMVILVTSTCTCVELCMYAQF